MKKKKGGERDKDMSVEYRKTDGDRGRGGDMEKGGQQSVEKS